MDRRKRALEATQETLNGQNMALVMEMAPLQAEREADLQRSEEQVDRERKIAQCFEAIGQIKGVQMLVEFGNVANLMWLKDVKEHKIYRDVPGIRTWDKFCESLGKDRRKVDEDLQNISVFGEQFMVTVANLRVGYRELKKLRQLTHTGDVAIIDNTITIGDKTIPVDEEHAEDIQAAIEWVLEENKTMSTRVGKLEKDFKGALKEETLSLNSQLKTQTLRVQELEKYEPHAHDETWCEEQMAGIAQDTATLRTSIGAFVIDPRLDGDRAAQAGVLAFLTQAQNLLYDLRNRFENAFSTGE